MTASARDSPAYAAIRPPALATPPLRPGPPNPTAAGPAGPPNAPTAAPVIAPATAPVPAPMLWCFLASLIVFAPCCVWGSPMPIGVGRSTLGSAASRRSEVIGVQPNHVQR